MHLIPAMLLLHTKRRSYKGFTLIELLVVIAIISLLSSVVLSAVQGARRDAQVTATRQEMDGIIDIMMLAQGERGRDLGDITGSFCTECTACRNEPQSQACENSLRSAFENVWEEAGFNTADLDAEGVFYDAWGNGYLLDENEGEYSYNPCRRDYLKSRGPDGLRGTSDDINIELPYSSTCL